jgi:hypothetical protein
MQFDEFGLFFLLRLGLRGRDLVNNVGKVMLQGGGTFGTFMGMSNNCLKNSLSL